ncbi:transporter substrate-binding domain-containing protein [Paenarthrobacter sp. NPDC091711]|uniref:ABC transporter substrate-binding protein n=1 Tax=Paenarthrobacter sp. NPDC091711 TaxID=3364385 RepID=UPI00382C0470
MRKQFMAGLAVASLLAMTACSSTPSATSSGAAPQAGGSAAVSNLAASDAVGDLAVNSKARDLLPAAIRDRGVLKVGGETSQPPYLFTDGATIKGLEADFIVAVSKTLGLTPEITNTKFAALVTGLTSRRFDVAMANFSDTKARQEQIDFVDYAKSQQTFVVKKGNPTKVTSMEELCGHKVAGATGAKSVILATEQGKACVAAGKPSVDVQGFPTVADAQLALTNGRVDALPIEYALARAQVQASNGELELVDTYYGPGLNGAGIRKGESDLQKALLEALQTLIDDGTYQKILDKWELPAMAIEKPVVNGSK